MKKPIIGIAVDRLKRLPPYQHSVEQAGGEVDVLLPESFSEEGMGDLDGVLLAGGGDVAAEEFGEEQHPKSHRPNKLRDRMELRLTQFALEKDLPLFGICRGLQVMNVALGGTLFQDIPDQKPSEILHDDRSGKRKDPAHHVVIHEKSVLHSILRAERFEVNSFHHQAIKKLGTGLIPTAWAEDGIIEGIELPGRSFFLGVQWHPEEYWDSPSPFRSLFHALIEASGFRKPYVIAF